MTIFQHRSAISRQAGSLAQIPGIAFAIMDRLSIWPRIRALARSTKSRWRFAARVTASGLLGYAAANAMHLPLQGLWMILTAIVVTQASAGGPFARRFNTSSARSEAPCMPPSSAS